jgi:hypothetical protein
MGPVQEQVRGVLLDARGRVTYAHRSAAELLGVEPGLSEPSAPGTRDPRACGFTPSETKLAWLLVGDCLLLSGPAE